MKRIVEARALEGFCLWVRFADGFEGRVDLSDLAGKGVFSEWNKPGVFESVTVTDFGAVAWGDAIDLCPDALYLRATGQKAEALFPQLRGTSAHA